MSSSRKESERAKFVQDKCQTLLTLMLRDEDNKYCVDCDAKGNLLDSIYGANRIASTSTCIAVYTINVRKLTRY